VLNEFEDLFKANFPQFYSDLNKQLRQFVEKFLEAFKQQQLQQRTTKDKQSSENTKQSDVVQDFFKKIHKYILSSATIKSHLEKLNAVVSVGKILDFSSFIFPIFFAFDVLVYLMKI